MIRNFVLTGLIIVSFVLTSKAQYNNDLVIEPILKTDTTSLGQKISYPAAANAEVTMLKITLRPGKKTGWHYHEVPVFAYVMKGTLTVELENKKTLQFKENSSFAEVIQTLHQGANYGTEDLILLAVYVGVKGKPLSIMQSSDKP